MKIFRSSPLLLGAFFLIFMGFPLGHVLLRAFFVNGSPSLHFFTVMASTQFFREVIYNSLNIALAVTLLSTLIAYPLALGLARFKIPFGFILHPLLLMPLVVPPFVGVLGVRQLFGRFGSVNMALLDAGIIERPIAWLGGGNVLGIIALQTIHVVPVLYLSLRASLATSHVALEEAAIMSGASRWRTLRRITIPLSYPGWFAGAVLVSISSFTDLGTPLVFEYRNVISVQIFNMLADLNENPVGYSFIVFVCLISLTLFYLSKASLLQGAYAGSGRSRESQERRPMGSFAAYGTVAAIALYVALSSIPQIAVLLVAISDDWFMSVLPQRWTVMHFIDVLRHPLSAHSLMTSLWLSAVASILTVIIGFLSAYLVARGRTRASWLFEVITIIPLAIPGIVFAFGYIGAFSGTPLDNRINPFPLLIAAYIVRRTPAMVRSAYAGLQEANVSLEEAALMVGARPPQVAWRILFPLMSRHLAVGAVLTFAYSMIEVSDGILLAMEERFYPISKAIYALMARPDGVELASALGSIVMLALIVAFYLAERLSSKPDARSISKIVATGAVLFTASIGHAEQRELIAASPHWEGIRREFERAFSEHWHERTGDTVVIRWYDIGGSSDIAKYLKANYRKSPSGVGIDLLFGGGLDNFLELARDGNLQSIELAPDVIERIPHSVFGVPLVSPSRDWFAAALNTFGILYNKVALERLHLPTPRTWHDLAHPAYFDLIGAGDPRKSGSMHAMYEIILQGAGWDEGWTLLQRLGGNVRNFSGGGTQVGKEIATAEIVYGLAIDTYASDIIYRVGAERIGFVVPEDYASVNGDGIAVLKGAPNRELARAFVEFVLSEKGQRLFYAEKGSPGGPLEYDLAKLPLLPSLYGSTPTRSVVSQSPFTWKGILKYDAELAGSRWNLVNDLFGVFILDLHERLVLRAKRHVDALQHDQQLVNYPPISVSYEESVRLSDGGRWGSDSARRSSALRTWAEQARATLPAPAGTLASLRPLPSLVFFLVLVGVIGRRLRNLGIRSRPRR
jgi:iron(III) transport system permease protein